MDNLGLMWKTLWQKKKLLVLSNFFFCHYVFKKASVAEASESVYMRERVKLVLVVTSVKQPTYINPIPHTTILQQTTLNVFCQNIENLHN